MKFPQTGRPGGAPVVLNLVCGRAKLQAVSIGGKALLGRLNRIGRRMGFEVRKIQRDQRIDDLYQKYKSFTMNSKETCSANLRLARSVTTLGCVIECGVWKGGSSAGMAEILGPDRQYFLFDSYQGHVDPEPVDGPAAFAWQSDKEGPWYFDNARVGTEFADRAMKMSGAKRYSLVKGYFDETLPGFTPPEPIAVLRIDCDWHKGTMTCLRALFPHLAPNGIMIADGYPDWDGYAAAIHEYLAELKEPARLKVIDGLYYIQKGARHWNTAYA